MPRFLACLVGLLIVGVSFAPQALSAADLPPAATRDVDFSKDIQPLLKKHCVACHGTEKQESGLRLDDGKLALQGGDSGKSIVAGDSAKSRLIQYVAGVDPDHIMPPEGDRLTAVDVGLLRAWIDRGAVWPESTESLKAGPLHWAYQPLSSSAPPAVQDSSFVRNPIDQFVLDRLTKSGLRPSAEADRYTLIRRLYLDLIGLLPTIQEVDAFVQDPRPNAYEALVDRLLDSPHFGERWGRHWLDMARYADSDGYEKDNARPDAYRWRDWVIDAINQDMPFDQFTTEQLAGDLLPNATDMQKLATAFHRQTLTNTEGGTDQEQFRVEACFDRTETTGAVWLGLTIGCARCHTHKYDAITQREYYQIFAFYNNGDEQTVVVPKSVAEVRAYELEKAQHDERVADLTRELRAAQAEHRQQLTTLEAAARKNAEDQDTGKLRRQILKPSQVSFESITQGAGDTPESKINWAVQKDRSVLISGDNPESTVYVFAAKANAEFDTLRLDALADKSLPAKGPGRMAHGNFVLNEVKLEVSATEDFKDTVQLPFETARADFEQKDKPWLAKNAIDGDDATGWAVGPEYGKNHWAEFRLKKHDQQLAGKYLRIRLVHAYGKQHTLGRFRLAVQTGFEAEAKIPEAIAKILALESGSISEEQRNTLADHLSREIEAIKPILDRLEALKKQAPAKPEVNARVIAQRRDKPRETFVLRRGEFLEPITDAQVVASGLSVLPALKSRNGDTAADRLDLAQWLIAPENPLTPRVAVNHVWQTLFGRGIVKTANDFGVRGDPPSHPEMLDWLAAEFSGKHGASALGGRPAWSRKGLIKLIVMSGTYRQSSKVNPQSQEIDPQNVWLSRQNRQRVEGEIVRDISLDAAGLLSRKIGGPSVYPPLPPGIAELSYAGNFKWTTSTGDDQFRRGMYTFFKRTAPHPNLITFDCPDANLTCVDRNSSNTPLQALVALNNASFTDAARGLAARALAAPGMQSDADRLSLAFRWCLSRPPSDFERGQLVDLLSSARAWYRDHQEDAKKLLDKQDIKDVSIDEAAAWMTTARVIINLDEFITRE